MPPEHNAPPLRALIYNRVSADPSGSRVSVESQDHENRSFCERQGWEVVGTIYDNDRSATRFATKAREGYQQVLSAITGQTPLGRVDVLVTWEASRAERNMDSYPELRRLLADHDVLHAYKGKVYDLRLSDDRFSHGLDVLLAEREAEVARERTLRSHRESARRGTPRGVTPFGYVREYDPHSGRMLAQTPNPETAPIVREIVARIIAGETLYAVAKDLNARNVWTPRGYRDHVAGRAVERAGWSSSMIRNLLSKPSLVGLRTHNGVVTGEATWEPLVSATDWAAIQAVLADPLRSRNERGVEVRHLLSGIAECGPCGAWLRPLRNRGRMTYVCAGLVPTAGKGHVSRSLADLDAYVTHWLIHRAMQPDFLRAFARAQQEDRGAASAAEQELAQLHLQQAELEAAAAERQGAQLQSVLRVLDGLAQRIEEAERRAKPRGVPPAVLELAGPDAAARWDAMTLERRRRAVRAIARVQVFRSNLKPGSHVFDDSSVKVSQREFR